MTIHPVPVRAVPKSELTPDELESLRLRHVHLQMRYRCYRKANKNYKNYGGRGIRVCERWLGKQGFFNFCKDMGDRPKGSTGLSILSSRAIATHLRAGFPAWSPPRRYWRSQILLSFAAPILPCCTSARLWWSYGWPPSNPRWILRLLPWPAPNRSGDRWLVG